MFIVFLGFFFGGGGGGGVGFLLVEEPGERVGRTKKCFSISVGMFKTR